MKAGGGIFQSKERLPLGTVTKVVHRPEDPKGTHICLAPTLFILTTPLWGQIKRPTAQIGGKEAQGKVDGHPEEAG